MNTESSTSKYPNIVLLVLDSVRGDRFTNQEEFTLPIDTLNKLAHEGEFYDNTYSTGSWTVPAHGSLFTGKLPSEHGAHAKHKYFDVEVEDTLPGVLSSLDYTTVGFSTNPWISDEFGFAKGFNEFYELRSSLPFADEKADPRDIMENPSMAQIARWVLSGNPFKRGVNGVYTKIFQDLPYAPAETMNDEIIDWVSNSPEEPFFLFANYMDAHEPYAIRNDFIDGEIEEEVLNFDWNLHCYKNGPETSDFQVIREIYDSSISYLDYHLCELIDHLDLEETLLIIVGDHGQALGEQDYWGHGTFLMKELLHVPLIINACNSLTNLTKPIVSLSDIPHLIYKQLNINIEFECSEKQMSDWGADDDLVVAESFGPHQEVDSIPESISESGYRMLIHEKGYMLRNLDSNEVTTHSNGNISQSEFLEYEEDIFNDINLPDSTEVEEIDDTTKNRLEDLGYL